jgi:flagellar biosynthesis protein FlhA
VQGNFVIGLIVFFVLIVVQYVVVTNGAQRVSEVAARFVLDAMPGQQMSIDADLNMGFIDQEEAKRRRATLEKEAAFYGAMDGASKFVKGDAIAGIVILLINIVGGLVIGIAQMGMDWSQALQTFTLLTIGDGIVTQVPALVISTATGIIVTRSSADRELSAEVLRQLVSFPKIHLLVVIALIGLVLLPGMPKWPIVLLAIPLVVAFFVIRRRAKAAEQPATADKAAEAAEEGAPAPAPVEVRLGTAVASAWQGTQSLLGDRVAALRKQYAADMGFTLPAVTFRDATLATPGAYEIRLFGDRFGESSLMPDRSLAIHASASAEKLAGVPTRDPAFGLPAVWIDAAEEERARARNYTIVDPVTVLITHLGEVLKTNVATLVTRSEVTRLLEGVRARQAGLLEELIPNVLSISDVQRVLQNLLGEGVAIRNLDLIVEVLADAGRHQKDPNVLTEVVRQRLGLSICQSLRGREDALTVMTIDPRLEAQFAQSIKASEGTGHFVIEPQLAEQFLRRLLALAEQMMRKNLVPVLLCAPDLRRPLKTFTSRSLPRLAVLSVSEIPHSMDLKSFGVISVAAATDAREAAVTETKPTFGVQQAWAQ